MEPQGPSVLLLMERRQEELLGNVQNLVSSALPSLSHLLPGATPAVVGLPGELGG